MSQYTDQSQPQSQPHAQWIDEDEPEQTQPPRKPKHMPSHAIRVQGAEAQRRLGEIRRRARAAMRSAGLTTDEIAVAMGVSGESVLRAERRDRDRENADAQSTPPA